MKDFIISILEALLTIALVMFTVGGFLVAGNANPFGDFNFPLALIGGLVGFCAGAMFTGIAFTLLRIKELLEEQVEMQRQQGKFESRSLAAKASGRAASAVVTLYDNQTQTELGTVTEAALQSLLEYADVGGETIEDTVYVMADALDLLEKEGVDSRLVGLLRAAISNHQGVELRWERS